jgi:hypothetical protein
MVYMGRVSIDVNVHFFVTRNTMNDTSYISGLFRATIAPSMHIDTVCQESRAEVCEADFADAAQ